MVDFSDSGSTIIERAVEISEDLIVEEELLVNADNIKDIFELERYECYLVLLDSQLHFEKISIPFIPLI